jgi:segregation and condensation protein B
MTKKPSPKIVARPIQKQAQKPASKPVPTKPIIAQKQEKTFTAIPQKQIQKEKPKIEIVEKKQEIAEKKESTPKPKLASKQEKRTVRTEPPPAPKAERKKASPVTVKRQLEAALFSAGRHMTEEELCKLVGETKPKLVSLLLELQSEYETRDGALRIAQDGESWKFTVAQPYTDIVTYVTSDTELPVPTMETLALVAYKSPVLQSDVIEARGNGAYDHIALLIDRGFITREKESRTFRLRLTEKFFDYFALEGEQDIKAMLSEVRRKRLEDERAKLAKKQKLGVLEVVELKGTQSTLPMPSAELTAILHEEEQKPEVTIIPEDEEITKEEKAEEKPQ